MTSTPQTSPIANSAPPAATLSKRRVTLVPLGTGNVPHSRPYVVKGLIDKASTFLIYGASQAGKSFLVIDLLMSVATGKQWMGHNTEKGAVVYVASEGRENISIRAEGWKVAHGLTVSDAYWPYEAEFNLLDAECVDALIAAVKESGVPAGLIVIDTLSSAIPGEDENSQMVISLVLQHLRRIAYETGAAVGVVHHVSKGNPREPRGNSALFNGVDTSVFVSHSSGNRSMQTAKQRDGATGTILSFDLQEQEVMYGDGSIGTTCIVKYNASPAIQNNRKQDVRRHSTADALLALARTFPLAGNSYECAKQGEGMRVAYEKLKDEAFARIYADRPSPDAQRKQFSRDLKALEDEGEIRREQDMIVIAAASDIAMPDR